ncbi:sugar O-acetyltransferase [Actinomyces oricola]
MPQSPASPASATSPEPAAAPEPAAGSTLPASSREIEVRRRMAAQELYTDEGPGLEALSEQRTRGKELAAQFNATSPRDAAGRRRLLEEILGRAGDMVWFEPPIHVAYGVHTHVGTRVYANAGLMLIDDSPITIGNGVMFGPHVTITTAGHPVHPEVRPHGEQFSAPVIIEDDVWVGGNVTILPGIRIGRGSVIAAGAVVTANVPPMVVAGGIPARVLRPITDADRQWTYTPPRTLDVPERQG